MPKVSLYESLWRGIRRSVTADQAVQWIGQGGGAFRCAGHLEAVCEEVDGVPEGLVEALRGGNTLEQVFEAIRDSRGELFQLIWFLECVGATTRLGGVDRTEVLEALEAQAEPVEHAVSRSRQKTRKTPAPAPAPAPAEERAPISISIENKEQHVEALPPEKGTGLEELGKGDDVAVQDWSEKEFPDNRENALSRAEDLMGIGAFGAALSFLEDARFSDPNNADILAALGWAHFKSSGGEDSGEAEDYIDLALTFKGNHPKALEYRARICLEKGEIEKARGLVGRLLSTEPKNRWAKAQQRQLGSTQKSKKGFGFWRGKNK